MTQDSPGLHSVAFPEGCACQDLAAGRNRILIAFRERKAVHACAGWLWWDMLPLDGGSCAVKTHVNFFNAVYAL
jgi:hypothetical protein